jgi:hypothetical protein
MEGDKITPERVIASTTLTNTVEKITFIPGNKEVVVRCIDGNGDINEYTADVTDEWAALSVDKKTDWKNMFKKVVAIALGLTSNEITGDIWD